MPRAFDVDSLILYKITPTVNCAYPSESGEGGTVVGNLIVFQFNLFGSFKVACGPTSIEETISRERFEKLGLEMPVETPQ